MDQLNIGSSRESPIQTTTIRMIKTFKNSFRTISGILFVLGVQTVKFGHYLTNSIRSDNDSVLTRWESWQERNKWMDSGDKSMHSNFVYDSIVSDSFKFAMQESDPRDPRCSLLDDLDLYMTI